MRVRLILSCLLLICALSGFGQVITRNILHSGSSRIYDLQLPSSWQQGDKLPLVLDLHYLGGDARDEDTLTNFSPIADTANFILCHPWGQGTNWNAGFNSPYTSGSPDVDFIRTVIDSIANEFGVDRRRIYATGMGQGGFLAQRLACELSDEIAAIASVSASMADSTQFYCQPARPVPVMLINGTADSVVAYAGNPGFWPGVESLKQFWLQKNGCITPMVNPIPLPDVVTEGSTINSYRYPCGIDSEVLLYEVVNGGFSWPGATDSLPNSGIINQDINAGIHIWDFFQRWALPDTFVSRSPAMADLALEYGPHPLQETLLLSFERLRKPGALRLLNAHGQLLQAHRLPAGSHHWELTCSGLPSGIYLLHLETSTGHVVRKLVKQ